MLQFEEYLIEKASAEYSGSKGQYIGVIGELLVGFYIRGGTGDPRNPRNKKYHMEQFKNDDNISPYDAFQQVAATFDEERFQQACKRAKYAADVLIKEAESRGLHVKDCKWTSKKGDPFRATGVEATQQEDDSDVYLTTEEGIYIGTSLKSSEKTLDVQTSNPGAAGTLGAEKILQEYRSKVLEAYPQLAKIKNIEERKAYLVSHPKIKQGVVALQDKYIKKIRDHVYKQLTSMDKDKLEQYIRDSIVHAYKTPAEKQGIAIHIRLNVAGTTEFKHKITAPGEDYEDILSSLRYDPNGVTIEAAGDTMINFYYYGKKFASTHVKFNDKRDFMSSIKMSGGDQGTHQLVELIRKDKEKQAAIAAARAKSKATQSKSFAGGGDIPWTSPNEDEVYKIPKDNGEEEDLRSHMKPTAYKPEAALTKTKKPEAKQAKKGTVKKLKGKVTGAIKKAFSPVPKPTRKVRQPAPERQPAEKFDWSEVEKDYTTTHNSLEDIASKHGLDAKDVDYHVWSKKLRRPTRGLAA